jgi:hypothetical protein
LCLFRGKGDAKSKKQRAAFRSHYSRIGEIRSLLSPSTPVVVMTATATKQAEKEIAQFLSMKSYHRVAISPNKENIRYSMISLPVFNLYTAMKPILDDVEANGSNACRTIVYCRKKEHCADLFELFRECLLERGYCNFVEGGDNDDRNRLFAMFHSKTRENVKETILQSFFKEDGHVRVLFCTIAFGMGIDVKGVTRVVHIGPSSEIEDYLQESGRAGRTASEQSFAIMVKYPRCTAGNVGVAMKSYVKEDVKCRREILLAPFDQGGCSFTGPKHLCCDNCATVCKCLCTCTAVDCACDEVCVDLSSCTSGIEATVHETIHNNCQNNPELVVKHETVTPAQRLTLQNKLLMYRSSLLSTKTLFNGIDLATGYTRKLVDSVVSSLQCIDEPATLREHFSFFDDNHVSATWDIICEVLEMDSDSDASGGGSSDVSGSDTDLVNRLRRPLIVTSESDSD